jgi:hypothetical protein
MFAWHVGDVKWIPPQCRQAGPWCRGAVPTAGRAQHPARGPRPGAAPLAVLDRGVGRADAFDQGRRAGPERDGPRLGKRCADRARRYAPGTRRRSHRALRHTPSSVLLSQHDPIPWRSPMIRDLPAATIIMSMSSTSCNACGGGCDASEKKHITWLPGYSNKRGGTGCGIEFTHITTLSRVPQMKNRVRRVRPDLEFIEFPTNGG